MANFSDSDRKRLEENPNILTVKAKYVSYTYKFKIESLKKFDKGVSPTKIFREAGIDLSLFNKHYPQKCLYLWKKVRLEKGNSGLKVDNRESNPGRPIGKPKKTIDPNDIEAVKARLAYLEVENDFLKKLHALAAKYPKKKDTN